MMPTMHRRRQWREKNEPGWQDIALAYTAGFWTCALCSLVIVTLWK